LFVLLTTVVPIVCANLAVTAPEVLGEFREISGTIATASSLVLAAPVDGRTVSERRSWCRLALIAGTLIVCDKSRQRLPKCSGEFRETLRI